MIKTSTNIFWLLTLTIILVFYQLAIKSQTELVQFEHYSLEEGLSQNTVYCVLQDAKGFLWLGTADGLNRYDGYKFRVFRNDPNDSTSISANRIFALCEDNTNTLWIGTYGGGLNKFNSETESFIHFKNNLTDASSLSDDEILSIYTDSYDILWVGTDGGGLNRFISENGKFKCYKNHPEDPGSLSDDEIRCIYEDHLGSLWIGTNSGGLNKFDREKEHFISYKHNPKNSESISDDGVLSIYEDSFDNLWVGTGNGGLNKFDRSKETFIHYVHNSQDQNSISANRIFDIIEDKSRNLWVGTMEGGLNKYISEHKKFISFRSERDNLHTLSSDGIFSLFEDRTGILWIGTYGGGVNKLDQSKQHFKLFRNDPGNPNSLSNNGVFSICEDKNGIIWIGTSGGLNKFDRNQKKFFAYHHSPFNLYGLSDEEVISIYEDKAGELWIGTYGGGLNLFDRRTNQFTKFKNDPNDDNSLSSNEIFSICEDNSGNLWIGTDGSGLNKFDKSKRQFTRYFHNTDDETSISANRIFSIHLDNAGNLWIGTDSGGLNKFNPNTGKFIHYKYKPGDPASISNDGVLSIYQSKSGELWIGTYGGGLNKFDVNNEKFEEYRIKDGLPNDVVYGILEDGSGNLWLSTNYGLSRFSPETKTFKNYDVTDGLQGNEFNQGSYFKTKTGEMLFGGPNGFNFFHPDSITDNIYPPQIVLTDFQLLHKPVSIGYDSLFGRMILQKSISETEQIELNYDDNVISLEFAALDFRNPEKNSYTYIMEGFDKDWTHTDASLRQVTYTNLDPGEYLFKVKGSNNDGIWNKVPASLRIIINPPWWATWWAYTVYGVLILLLILVLRQYDLRRQRLKQQLELEHEHARKLEEIDRMKSRFFTNISHEFRTPLTLILGPADKIISESPDKNAEKQAGLIRRNAARLLDLINQLLDLSKLEAGKLKLEAARSNLSGFVKGIAMAFESVAEKKDIELRLLLEKQDVEAFFDKDKMQKILTNILSNAFKFTSEGGKVEVRLAETDRNSVLIIVKDTGTGISPEELSKIFDMFYQSDGSATREQEGSGIGLALTKELVELHKGKISVNSEEGKWTEVVVELPLGREHLKDEEVLELQSQEITEKEISIKDYLTEKVDDLDFEEAGFQKNIVLVVEDNSDVREYIKDSISQEYNIIEAVNGEQGIRKAEKFIPDLIVCDIMMPKMDGYEMTRRIKQDEKTSHIPVILLTAKSDKDSKLEGLGLGADDYLIKPFDTKELIARIRNLIESRRLLQQKFSDGSFVRKIKGKSGLNPLDEKFIEKILSVVTQHLSEEEFSIEDFAVEVGMSRAQIYRKLKAITGKSPSLFLRSVRLNKAKEMIQKNEFSISEISFKVGFSSPAYFSRCFKDEFGYSPSELSN